MALPISSCSEVCCDSHHGGGDVAKKKVTRAGFLHGLPYLNAWPLSARCATRANGRRCVVNTYPKKNKVINIIKMSKENFKEKLTMGPMPNGNP